MPKQALSPSGLPAPSGPYSQGVKSGRLVFVAGQVSVDANGKTVGAGDIRAQTRQALKNVEAVLAAAGAGFDDILKVTIFLTDVGQIGGVQEVRPEFFREPYPASTLVEVSRLVSPEWLIEIEAVALVGG